MSRHLYHANDLGGNSKSSDQPTSERRVQVSTIEEANLISSEISTARDESGVALVHAPTLDIDHACELRPSETPGHYHLLIDVPMPWPSYVKLLNVLAEVGIIEPGYASASIERGATFVAIKPWKGNK